MFKDNNDKISMMRISVFVVLVLGAIIILTGLIGWLFLGKPDALPILSLGATSFISPFAKAMQKKYENS